MSDVARHAAALDAIADILHEDPSVLVVTGAGVSSESGLPTYRGVGGLYDDRDTPDGVPVELALSARMFAARPELTWKYLHQIAEACRDARPNRAHEVIAQLEARLTRLVVLTQNVDGLHRAAGSREVICIHGDMHTLRCSRCDWSVAVDAPAEVAPVPRCPMCDAVARPDVVLFQELLPPDAVGRLERELRIGFDVVMAIGTTAAFPYIVAPVHQAAARGDVTIEINPARTPLSGVVRWPLRLRAGDALDALAQRLGLGPAATPTVAPT